MKQRRDLLANGVLVWIVGLAPLFAWDVWLISHGHGSMSSRARSHPIIASVLLAYLCAHLLVRGSHALDPLSAIGRRLSR